MRLLMALSTAWAAGCGGMTSAGERSAVGGEPAADSCGGETMMVTLRGDERRQVEGYERDASELSDRLDSAMALEASPDCGPAAELRDRICALSERICAIADRHPEHARVARQCEDGRGRCRAARDEVSGRCD